MEKLDPEILIRRHLPESPWTYTLLNQQQNQIASRVFSGGRGALLLSELAPVITFGKRATPKELLMSRDLLKKNGVEVFETDRGGLATYHGPGQWVLFAVDRLERLTGDPKGVRKAVEALLNVAHAVGSMYKSPLTIREGAHLGVWSEKGKVAAVGVRVHRGVLLHGVAINGYRTETSFMGVRPCGLSEPVDFLLEDGLNFEDLGKKIQKIALNRLWN